MPTVKVRGKTLAPSKPMPPKKRKAKSRGKRTNHIVKYHRPSRIILPPACACNGDQMPLIEGDSIRCVKCGKAIRRERPFALVVPPKPSQDDIKRWRADEKLALQAELLDQ